MPACPTAMDAAGAAWMRRSMKTRGNNARIVSRKEKGRLSTPFSAEAQQTYDVAARRQEIFCLDELTDPPADEVPNGGDAHAHRKHVEP